MIMTMAAKFVLLLKWVTRVLNKIFMWTPSPRGLKFTLPESQRIYRIFQMNILLPQVILVYAATMIFCTILTPVLGILNSRWQSLLPTSIVSITVHLLAIILSWKAPKLFWKLQFVITIAMYFSLSIVAVVIANSDNSSIRLQTSVMVLLLVVGTVYFQDSFAVAVSAALWMMIIIVSHFHRNKTPNAYYQVNNGITSDNYKSQQNFILCKAFLVQMWLCKFQAIGYMQLVCHSIRQ